jgi:hypothetical protein
MRSAETCRRAAEMRASTAMGSTAVDANLAVDPLSWAGNPALAASTNKMPVNHGLLTRREIM